MDILLQVWEDAFIVGRLMDEVVRNCTNYIEKQLNELLLKELE